jgi:hypothetical protein
LKEGFQRWNGDLDLFHSFENVIAFALALNVFEKRPSLLEEKAQVLLRDPGRPGLQQVNRRRIDLREKIGPPSHHTMKDALDMLQVANDWLSKRRSLVVFY